MSHSNIRGEFPAVSICVTVKNRSRVQAEGRELLLFPNCVRSIVNSAARELNCELVVTDWESDDWPLAQWLPEVARDIPTQILNLTGKFSRGAGRNAAARAAHSRQLFFLDADCLISKGLLEDGLQSLEDNRAYFPVLFSFSDPNHCDGWWRHEGYGNCMVRRDVFDKVGGFPEYGYWGREDVDFFDRIRELQEIDRKEAPGFYHQWHPNDFDWKNRYGETSPLELEKRAERLAMSVVSAKLEQTVAVGDRFILVDEEHIRAQMPPDRHAVPFLERNGEYGGVPGDSAEAISELERLRSHGASYIAFPWFTFWWLDYYNDFRDYLCSQYRRIVETEHILIFDLKRSISGRGGAS